MNTLLTWLGKADLERSREDQEAAIATIALKNEQPFDQIVILANTWDGEWADYVSWLKARLASAKRPFSDVVIQKAKIRTPIHYQTIFEESKNWINKLSKNSESLTISLTSGTPAMIATAVILGKSRDNVRFIQSSQLKGIENVDIPVDFAREYVKSAAKGVANKAVRDLNAPKLLNQLVAKSSKMKELIGQAKVLATSELPVLVLGETGTGKEVMSNAIHLGSLRADQPFKAVNCGALPQNLVDSILFGHEKGAFTGADKQHKGLFEQANGGTLFLDEVGELTPDVQVKLLRVLQEGCITRVGGETVDVDVRIIAATHRDLIQMLEDGDFREDLFYRLAIGVIHIPSLKERVEDIPSLVEEISNDINSTSSTQLDKKRKNISENGIKFIISQSWPGNIRELQNTLNRAFLWTSGNVINKKELEDAMISRRVKVDETEVNLTYGQIVDANQVLDNKKKSFVLAALKATGNNISKASKMLMLNSPSAFRVWMESVDVKIEK